MEYIHVKNLEKYHPGYTDRELKWGKVYFTIVQGDPEFELIVNEVDKWRFIAMVCLELEAKKALPNIEAYWIKKFDIKKRSMSLTLQMLHNFIEVVTDEKQNTCIEKRREDKEEDKDILSGKPDFAAPILYLNEKTKSKFDPKNKSNQDLVRARFNEGRTLDQFKQVIDKKAGEWLTDEKMMKYLRPSTLFSRTNFENYINEAHKPNTTIIFKKEQ